MFISNTSLHPPADRFRAVRVACISVNGYPTLHSACEGMAAPEAEGNTHCARETTGRRRPRSDRVRRANRARIAAPTLKGARSRPPPAELLISGSPDLERVIRKVFAEEIWTFLISASNMPLAEPAPLSKSIVRAARYFGTCTD